VVFSGEYKWQDDLFLTLEEEIFESGQEVWGYTNDGISFAFQTVLTARKANWDDTELVNDPNYDQNEDAQVAASSGLGWLIGDEGEIPIWFQAYSVTLDSGERASYLAPSAIDMNEGTFDLQGGEDWDYEKIMEEYRKCRDDAYNDYDLCVDKAENDVIRCLGDALGLAAGVGVVSCLLKYVKIPGIGILTMKQALIICGVLAVGTFVGALLRCALRYWADRRDCRDTLDWELRKCLIDLPDGFMFVT